MECHQILLAGALSLCLLAAGAGAQAGGHPGCRKCGDADVPYPFGVDSDDPRCRPIHHGFQLSCNKTVEGAGAGAGAGAGGPKLFAGTVEVARISLADGKAWMRTPISWRCYDPGSREMRQSDSGLNTTGSPYWFSDSDNKIVVIGCNTLAYMRSDMYVIGCFSTCLGAKNGSCSGASCCEADLPKGIQYYNSYFNAIYNSTQCSYMALIEKTAFSFSTAYLKSTTFYDEHKGKTPVVTTWVISTDTCEGAKNNKALPYACVSSNSGCVNSSYGYRCRCSRGYEGNPYIPHGCKDVNECLNSTAYPCAGICQNTPGSYTCSCPQGQHEVADGVCVLLPDDKTKSSAWVMPVVGASVGIVLLAVTTTCAFLIQERRKLQHIKQKYFQQHGGLLLFEEMKSKQGISFTVFSEEELQQATDKFNERRVLGRGGHGTVYKGILQQGNLEVAVKRCMTIDEQQKKEFGKEMLILSQINHRNIVKLLGCCLEVEVPMLVYEFVPNGTLFHLIHGNHGRHVSLRTRLRIAHESAEALAYLHSWASPPILHGDIKSSNILLDDDYTVKVSDFGASILAPTDESQFVTLVQGTCGYLDPEYMQTCQLTDKSDVYSFGVVLLELLTGKKAFNLEAPEHEKSLSMRFLSTMKGSKLEEILDDQIKNKDNIKFLKEIAKLANLCLEMCGENRPSMKEVAEKLDGLRRLMQHPCAQQNSKEMESLLGESCVVSSAVVTSGNFSIDNKAVKILESGC